MNISKKAYEAANNLKDESRHFVRSPKFWTKLARNYATLHHSSGMYTLWNVMFKD